jgi:LmbE family N-acetylglucosaminyl deacetylase
VGTAEPERSDVIAVISPHLDDAAFSLTEHILTWVAEGQRVKIVTVFGGIPADEKGFKKHSVMHAEHKRVCEALGVEGYHCNYFDDVYQPRPPWKDVIGAIQAMVGRAEIVVAPVGIQHPDHRLVASAIDRWGRDDVWFYDELPYYVQYPQESFAAWWRYERIGHALDLIDRKWEIVSLYESQVGELERRTLLAPERCWRPL